jgi:hypothetical protein
VPPQTERAIHRHAFWLYGVLVGVSIKEALETSVAHLVNPGRLVEEARIFNLIISFPHPGTGRYPEIIRLTTFLVLIIRFYFGAAYFFGAAYESETAAKRFPVTNYAMDFVFGFVHFICFVILALLLDIHTTPVHWFPYLVGVILIYDVLWYASSFRRSTRSMLFWWTLVNLFTALISGLVYVIIDLGSHNPVRAETCAFYIVIAVSLLDIGMMMAKRPFFQPIGSLVPPDVPDEPSESPDPADPVPE